MKKGVKITLEFLIEFILVICVTTLILSIITSSTVLNKEYIKSKLVETNYYGKMYGEVQSNIENYVGPSGLEEDDIKGIISEEKVKEDTNIILDNIYSGIIDEINTDEIKSNLNNKISNIYIERIKENNNQKVKNNKENIQISVEQQEAINEYVNKISDTYVDTVLHTSYEKNINQVMTNLIKYINLAKKVLVSLIAVLAIILLAINYKKIYIGLTKVAIPIVASGILFIIINLVVKAKINISNIMVFNEALSELIKTTLFDILQDIINCGLLMGVIGIFIIIVSNIVDYILNKDD